MSTSPSVDSPGTPLDRAVATRAARWFMLLASGEASDRDRQALERWRRADSEHERAWQRAEQVSRKAGLVPAPIGQAVLRGPVRGIDRRKALTTLVLLMTAAPAGWLAVQSTPWRAWRADYATATGQQRRVTLPDGTQVMLNTASAVDVAFDERQRRLLLRQGEIMVTTARDPQLAEGRPARAFVVETAEGQAMPVGTRFIVRQASGRSVVSVLEGAVELHPRDSGASHLLRAGYSAGFTRDSIAPEQRLQADAAMWTRGIVAAQDMRLDRLLAELGRYRTGILDCDPAIGGLRVTGAFQVNDMDAALANLAQLLSLDIRYRTRWWVTLLPAEKTS
ncbi:FecR domain-containing protein [Herbaspirillum chlorophenolicum]|nr:FecR domain-containing protein [Herbaspirillum chlorophenolicum]